MAHERLYASSRHAPARWCAIALSLVVPGKLLANANADAEDTARLKELSLDELLDIEVSSVSRRVEPLSRAASAIQVVTREDVRRSGATSIPEALRLAPNLQVAQVNASQWAVSARGFNNVLANKLLVLIDGRTVYTPLYGGVFWDAQDTLLADLDRIEVISGPGGTLWGANAVNGVINITTRSAQRTQGLYLEAAGGDELVYDGAFRYGGSIGEDFAFRFYGKAFERDDTLLLSGADAGDTWRGKQGGFRSDWNTNLGGFTFQGDVYRIHPNPDGGVGVQSDGHNVLGRMQRVFNENSDAQLQLYYDRTKRDFHNGFTESLLTFDMETQHRLDLEEWHQMIWGVGVRWMEHEVTNLQLFRFLPQKKILRIYSGYVQHELEFFADTLRVTAGVKYEDHEYTGGDWLPNLRLGWSPTETQTLWAAASHAVRTPTRIDRDFYLSLTPTFPFIVGGKFRPETVNAYEVGWRAQPHERISTSLATFYNQYDHLRSVEPGPPPFNLPATFENGVEGDTYGAEFSAAVAATNSWQLRAGYTWVRKRLKLKPGSRDSNRASAESNDPEHQALLQSMLELPGNLAVDGVVRYVDTLHAPNVPSYVELDFRISWQPHASVELAVIGQNLLDDSHREFIPSSPSAREIERSVHGRIVWHTP